MWDGAAMGMTYRKQDVHPWEEWFAWRPVKLLNGKRVWLKKIYRRCINTYVNNDDWTRYEYGTMFDVLSSYDDAIVPIPSIRQRK